MESLINEAKSYQIKGNKTFENDLNNLPENWNTDYLFDAIELLKHGKKLNKEYKHHFLNGRNEGIEDIHIPDPNAYLEGQEYSDWMLWYKTDNRKKIIHLLRTGSHEYLRGEKA